MVMLVVNVLLTSLPLGVKVFCFPPMVFTFVLQWVLACSGVKGVGFCLLGVFAITSYCTRLYGEEGTLRDAVW
jgi:hypothetical protein